MFRLKWSERAAQDFAELLNFIAAEDPANARRVRERILNSLKHLESFSLGVPGPNGTFKLYIPKTSYFVFFRRNEAGEISIRAFMHGARDWEQIDWEKL